MSSQNTKTLTVDGIDYPLDPSITLLENLESQAIKVEFQCRDGYCGACRCQLVAGEIKYINEPIAYIRNNEVLTCCSQAINNIKIATF